MNRVMKITGVAACLWLLFSDPAGAREQAMSKEQMKKLLIRGAKPVDHFRQVIDRLLKETK